MPDSARARTGLQAYSGTDDLRTIDTTMQSAFDVIETLMPLDSQGTAAPAGTGKRGEWYLRTSTGELFRSTGSAWERKFPPPDGTITDVALASPNNGTWKTFLQFPRILHSPTTGTFNEPIAPVLEIKAADLAVSGKTTQIRLLLLSPVNAIGLGSGNLSFELGLIAGTAGGSGVPPTPTVGPAIVTATVSAGWSSGVGVGYSSTVTLPGDGEYGIRKKATVAAQAGHQSFHDLTLQYRNV